jgi:hypothetical protein
MELWLEKNANTLIKQRQTADKRWSSSLDMGLVGANNSSPKKRASKLRNVAHSLRKKKLKWAFVNTVMNIRILKGKEFDRLGYY